MQSTNRKQMVANIINPPRHQPYCYQGAYRFLNHSKIDINLKQINASTPYLSKFGTGFYCKEKW